MTEIHDDVVLVRGMDVTARLTRSVENLSPMSKDGILLETLIGRYVLDRDATEPWLLIDGVNSVAEIAEAVAGKRGVPTTSVLPAVRRFSAELAQLGLVEVVPGENAAIS